MSMILFSYLIYVSLTLFDSLYKLHDLLTSTQLNLRVFID